ncbi:GNAT family N-acetyltransferase [Chromobacterium haemolyticum]|uniref:GNAT family N-acetyltransferase n=1 Tax=Chromobacterium fluminis TaxID=3044269 RepID=A0ABX0L4W4_9NEIS|nr:GNAT family N-acetyltransferase [Chromobacterium haemolyticum]NHR04611.1 GNAT family N-acetyltransferase [Chromobacterium haemolyticum]
MPTIRSATQADAACLAALSIQVWLSTYVTDGVRRDMADYVLNEFTPANFETLIASPSHHLLAMEQDGFLLGYALMKLDSPCRGCDFPTVEMLRLYLVESRTGEGLGRRLLAAARRWALDLPGQPRLWLTVWHRNERAIAFYRRLGMTVHGECHFELEGARHLNYVMLDCASVGAVPTTADA